jgi:hypothetical protein
VIESQSSGRVLAQDTCPPSFQGSNPFIGTENSVSIFLTSSEKSLVNFDRICSLIREELDDCALLDFRVHRMISVFSCPDGGNEFLRETEGRSGEFGNGT